MNLRRTFLAMAASLMLAGTAYAQNTANGECSGGLCGTPEQSGGGCGCGCGCSILIAFTDQGDTYQYADDFDDDGIEDDFDNCPFRFNPDQIDADGDLRGDLCDNCRLRANFDLSDVDGDSLGDACDDDADNDLILNQFDNCRLIPNPAVLNVANGRVEQFDTDGDGDGDPCDDNDDGDACPDFSDACPLVSEVNCANTAISRDRCFADMDADLLEDVFDNCVAFPNPGQEDRDGDGIGDACDQDLDNDGHVNGIDNCPQVPNADLSDIDRDGIGDACDPFLCYVITDQASCLDPAAPFAVHAGRPITVETGVSTPVFVFANRENTHIRYTWTIVSQPSDGDARIINPTGAVSVSSSVQYIYEGDHLAQFEARVPGQYELELLGELVWPQYDAYPDQKTNKSRVTINVTGEAKPAFFCGAAPGSTGAAAVLLGLLALRRRRRR